MDGRKRKLCDESVAKPRDATTDYVRRRCRQLLWPGLRSGVGAALLNWDLGKLARRLLLGLAGAPRADDRRSSRFALTTDTSIRKEVVRARFQSLCSG